MPRKATQDLVEFTKWMLTERCLRRVSAQVYTSHVRACLRELNDLSASSVGDYFNLLYEINSWEYNPRVVAWKAFSEWAATKGVLIPLPEIKYKKKQSKSAPEIPPLPNEVRKALIYIKNACREDLTMQDLEHLTWDKVDNTAASCTYYEVRNANKKVTLGLDKHWVDVIREWAQPADGGAPIVPVAPGSYSAYPWRGLRREMLLHRSENDENG